MPETPSSTTAWRNRIATAKAYKDTLIAQWRENVQYRAGKPFATVSDEDRVAPSLDWSRTKRKIAQLFSQVPEVMLTPKQPAFAPAVPVFAKVVNETLGKARVGDAMIENLADVINAAGIAAVVVGYDARTETVDVPAIDLSMFPPDQQLLLLQSGELPMEQVDRVVDARFTVKRISPADLLWPVDFTGSNFDEAPWIGRTGRMTWAEAKAAFNLEDKDREAVVGGGGTDELLSADTETERRRAADNLVTFDEVFYQRALFDSTEKYFAAIHHLVFVRGRDTPVVDEPWKGQRFDEQTGRYVGACRFPIRVLTLTYISDTPVPPSDSAIGRPQVDELTRSRSQMVQQREHSTPLRWFDVNRVDPAVQDQLSAGTWQGFIPVQGQGSNAIGEVSRASYPRESFEFDRVAQRDLDEAWSLGPNQGGTFATGERSASEAAIIQQNFSTIIGVERARVVAHFVSIAEVLAGLLALYGEFALPEISPQDAQRLQSWDRTRVANEFVYTVRADASVLLDAQQRIQRLMTLYSNLAPSGYVNVEPIVREIVALTGLDPEEIVRPPQPKASEPINISVRNAEDLQSPLFVSMLVHTQQAPTPEDIAAAHQIIQAAATPPPALPPPPMPPQLPPPGVPLGPPTTPVDELMVWETAPRVNRRRAPGAEDGGMG